MSLLLRFWDTHITSVRFWLRFWDTHTTSAVLGHAQYGTVLGHAQYVIRSTVLGGFWDTHNARAAETKVKHESRAQLTEPSRGYLCFAC